MSVVTLMHNLLANGAVPLFLVLSVEFYQAFNGILYQLKKLIVIPVVDVNERPG